MNIVELKDELGLPKRKRYRSREPSVVLTMAVTLPKSVATNLLHKMEADEISQPDLLRRLIRYYIADHDGYKIR